MKVTERVSELTAADIGAVSADDLEYLGGTAPAGGIVIWSGSVDDIPSGWYLCNGENGTPDMSGMFVISTTIDAEIGTTAGATTHEVQAESSAAGSVGNTVLTTSQLPSHEHSGPMAEYGSFFDDNYKNVPGFSDTIGAMQNSGSTGGGNPHDHTFSTDVYSAPTEVNAMPLYLAIAFIMYTGVVI